MSAGRSYCVREDDRGMMLMASMSMQENWREKLKNQFLIDCVAN